MVKAGILVSNLECSLTKYIGLPLKESFERAGLESIIIPVSSIKELEKTDVVYLLPHAIKQDLRFLDEKEIPCLNSYKSYVTAMDKIESSKKFIEHNISTPKTLITNEQAELTKFVEENGKSLLKYPYGCAGYGHFLVRKEGSELIAENNIGSHLIEFTPHKHLKIGKYVKAEPYYLQKFISDNEEDNKVYRAYVVGSEVKVVSLRTLKDKPIVNAARGASYTFLDEIDDDFKDVAMKTANAIGFEMGVVDILKDHQGRNYVIECDCDGFSLHVDRKYKKIDSFCDKYDFDFFIGQRLKEIADGDCYRK